MKPLSKKRVFILTMFLWVIDVVCVVLLALSTRPLTTILFAIAWTCFFGYLVWRMIDRILSDEGQHIIEETGYVGIVSDFAK